MSERNTDPDPHPRVERLGGDETEDVIALVGFLGPRGRDARRLYADAHLQRWLDLPEIIDSEPAPGDPEGRTIVWVSRAVMQENMFTAEAEQALKDNFEGAGMSVWQLLPDSRYDAAAMLGLLLYPHVGEYEEVAAVP